MGSSLIGTSCKRHLGLIIRKYATNYDTEKIAVVPDDFRMYAGDPTRDHYNSSDPSHEAISFQCVGGPTECECSLMMQRFHLMFKPRRLIFPVMSNVHGCDLRHHSQTVGTARTHTCPTMVTSRTLWTSMNLGHVLLAMFESLHCSWKVSSGSSRSSELISVAYYKMSESLGPEYEWYPGCLVL